MNRLLIVDGNNLLFFSSSNYRLKVKLYNNKKYLTYLLLVTLRNALQ